MTDDFLKFDGDKFNIDDFQFDISSAIPENELLEFNSTAFTALDNQFNSVNGEHHDQQQQQPQQQPQQLQQQQFEQLSGSHIQPTSMNLDNLALLRQNSISNVDPQNSFHNSYISPINSPYTTQSHLSTSFQPQRKDSIYDTLESMASPQQNNADALTAQYFSPPPNRSIPLSTSRKSSHLGPSSIQTFNTSQSMASPHSFNDALSPYSSFNDFKSPRSMAASPAGVGSLPKQQLSKEEKLRRRREFHNQVERRRRDLIKEKIKELGQIVPPSLLYVDSDGKEVKASKTVIINKTVEYVVHLHKVMKAQEVRKQALIQKIAELEQLPDVNTPRSQTGEEPDIKSESQSQPDMSGIPSHSNSNSYANSPMDQIKFETEGADITFDVNELLQQHSAEGWDSFTT
ncbi:CYFA0S07e04104g1_1 [Cyberlindnera fabianii]|uniref:CYFA0S07e04104g1_1 n=1 Tax=Cyberlindnera fabianii TaxID=36022 RepID=A0A061AVM3_CYBFA|nr:CYFA0S07e04104g1_1 [Cyberlindnera fabianii]